MTKQFIDPHKPTDVKCVSEPIILIVMLSSEYLATVLTYLVFFFFSIKHDKVKVCIINVQVVFCFTQLRYKDGSSDDDFHNDYDLFLLSN